MAVSSTLENVIRERYLLALGQRFDRSVTGARQTTLAAALLHPVYSSRIATFGASGAAIESATDVLFEWMEHCLLQNDSVSPPMLLTWRS